MVQKREVKHVHLEFLLTRMPFKTTIPSSKWFDASAVQFSQVSKKSFGKRLLHQLFQFGMSVSSKDVALAVELLPDSKVATLEVIVDNYKGPPQECLARACEVATKLKKLQLLECLNKRRDAVPSPSYQVYIMVVIITIRWYINLRVFALLYIHTYMYLCLGESVPIQR